MMTEFNTPRRYQAFGTVEGVLDLQGKFAKLWVGEIEFPAIGYIPRAVCEALLPGQVQRFCVFPLALQGKLGFKVLKLATTTELGLKLKGCWEVRFGAPYFVVYRNTLERPEDKLLRIILPLSWDNAPEANGLFWELKAEIRGTELTVIEAEGPFPPPPKVTQFQPRTKETKAAKARKAVLNCDPIPPLSVTEIQEMATPAKVQLICKLSQVPPHRELPDKKIEFFISAGNGHIFTVRVKRKMFKKLTEHGFEHWSATVTGNLGATTATGFELDEPSIQIFEKKAKSENPDTETRQSPVVETAPQPQANPHQRSQSAKAEAHLPVEQRKSLLHGVQLR